MTWKYKPYIPKTISELIDLLNCIVLESPLFEDDSGYFPGKSIETDFAVLGDGLNNVKEKLGSDRYIELINMSTQMRACFEADPKDSSGETLKGRNIALDMVDILKSGKSADYWGE